MTLWPGNIGIIEALARPGPLVDRELHVALGHADWDPAGRTALAARSR